MEQITHGVHEDGLGTPPPQRHLHHMLMDGQPKSVRIVGLTHGFEAE